MRKLLHIYKTYKNDINVKRYCYTTVERDDKDINNICKTDADGVIAKKQIIKHDIYKSNVHIYIDLRLYQLTSEQTF